MDHYELGVTLATAPLAELRRHADRWRLASRLPGRTAGRRGIRRQGRRAVQGRHERAADRAGGGRAAAATPPEVLGEQPRRQPC
jgi:hypothetical protein